MKRNYFSPTIFNASNMNLSTTSHGRNSIVLENPLEGAILPAVALSASLAVVIGRKDIGEKGSGITKRRF